MVAIRHFNPLPPHGGRPETLSAHVPGWIEFQSTPSAWRETPDGVPRPQFLSISIHSLRMEGDFPWSSLRRKQEHFNPLPPHGGRLPSSVRKAITAPYFNPLPPHGGRREPECEELCYRAFQSTPSAWRETYLIYFVLSKTLFQSTPSAWRETPFPLRLSPFQRISIHSLRMEGDSKTAQESVFHFAYPCTILQKRMQKTTFCTRKNGFFRKKGEKFGAKPSASFCAPMIRTDTFPLNFSHRISGSSMSMVSFAPICSTFD